MLHYQLTVKSGRKSTLKNAKHEQKEALIAAIVETIARGKASPVKETMATYLEHARRGLHDLDIGTLDIIHKTHEKMEEGLLNGKGR